MALTALPLSASADELLLEWTSDLAGGMREIQVKWYLEARGISPQSLDGNLPFTSEIRAPGRRYLFCNDRLATVQEEWEQVDGTRFNWWMTALFATEQHYGDPAKIEFDDTWREVKFRWNRPGDTTLLVALAGTPPDRIHWSRELTHEPSLRPCQ
jgi:hypothetical protein